LSRKRKPKIQGGISGLFVTFPRPGKRQPEKKFEGQGCAWGGFERGGGKVTVEERGEPRAPITRDAFVTRDGTPV